MSASDVEAEIEHEMRQAEEERLRKVWETQVELVVKSCLK